LAETFPSPKPDLRSRPGQPAPAGPETGSVTKEELLQRQGEKLVVRQGAQPVVTSAGSAAGAAPAGDIPALTLWGDVWRRLRRNRLAIVGLGIILTLVLTALLAPWVAPYPPDLKNLQISNQPPSLKHWFGTDILGQDYFSRVVYGARVSIAIGVVATGIALVTGLILGAAAGYFGKSVDAVIMRLADTFFAFPLIAGAIVIVTVFGSRIPRLLALFIAIGIFGWATVARLFRASILQVKNTEYVEAARALGAGHWRILSRHVIPNALAPIIVYATIFTGAVILTEAALSFLGVGVPVGTPAWGLMVADGKSYMTTEPWLVLFPGLAIALTVLGFIFLGDGLRDAMDPRLR
jgi:peptide/nickel transport system permease protein